MKKYITIAALLAAGTAFANASYKWVGPTGTITADDWKNVDNWESAAFNENTTDIGNGPGTSGSGLWDEIIVNGAVDFSAIKFEGWLPKFTLSGGAVFNGTLNKIQEDSSFTINEGSSFKAIVGGNYYGSVRGGTVDYNIYAENGLEITVSHGIGSTSIFNFGEKGSATFKSTGSNISFAETTISAKLDASTAGLNERVLLSLDNMTLSSETTSYAFEGWTASNEEITTENYMEHIGEYWVDTTNGVKVLYVAPIPEPSAFGLLAGLGALALVASRRRRK